MSFNRLRLCYDYLSWNAGPLAPPWAWSTALTTERPGMTFTPLVFRRPAQMVSSAHSPPMSLAKICMGECCPILSPPPHTIYIKQFTPWNRSGIFLLKCIYQCTLLQIYICPFIQDRIELIIIFYISGDKMCQWIFQNMCASRIRNLHAQMRLSKSVRGPKQLYWNYSYF